MSSFGIAVTRGPCLWVAGLCLASCGGGGQGGGAANSTPTVTLTSNTTAIVSGSSVTLTWSSTNATSCAASGGWTGTKATSGSESVGPLSADATYTLTCNGSGGSANQTVTISVNQPPISAITANPYVTEYAKVTLDGTSSYDPDGRIASYAWAQTAGPAVPLTNPTAATTYFVAPHVTGPTDFSFSLTVQDDKGASATGAITIHVRPATSGDLAVRFLSLRFLEASSGDAHSDYFPVSAPPLVDEMRIVQAALSGQIASATFDAKDINGVELGQLPLISVNDPSTPPYIFGGSITVPSVPFSVVASGTTRDGQSFQVTAPQMILPATLRVGFYPALASAKAGDKITVQVQVTNGGVADTFNLSFTDPFLLLTKSYNAALPIASGAVATLSVDLLVPSNIASTHLLTLAANVTAQGDSTRVQTGTFTLLLDRPP